MKNNRYFITGLSLLVTVLVVIVTTLSFDTFNSFGNFNNDTQLGTPTPAPIISLSATPDVINLGSSAMLTWDVQNSDSCVASGDWAGTEPMQGSIAVMPLANSTYRLTCFNSHRRAHRTAEVVVNPVPTACSDYTDNDGDGLVDMVDPGCVGPSDLDEFNIEIGE